MERNANYALVGITSTLLLIGLIVFSLWLAAFRFGQAYDLYDIVFKGPVRGLSQGGEVHFNGIKVGEVNSIALDAVDATLVIARVEVGSEVPIRIDSVATLEPQGITGVNFIQITAGTSSLPLLKDTVPHNEIPRIRSEPSTFSDLLDGSGNVLAKVDEALDRINRVLSDQNLEHINSTLDDIRTLTAELGERKSIIADTEQAVASVDDAAQRVSELAAAGNALLSGDGHRSMAAVADAARDLGTMMNRLEGPVDDFATAGLPQIMSAIASLQQAIDNLDHTLGEVQQSPRGLVAKPPAHEIEVPP